MREVDWDEEIEVISDDGLVMVELDWIGEGASGDYDPENIEDDPLLRFTLYRKFEMDKHAGDKPDFDRFCNMCDVDAYEDGDWAAVNDGSYCTNLSAFEDREHLENAAKEILAQVESDVRDLTRQKRLFEELSWIRLGASGEVVFR